MKNVLENGNESNNPTSNDSTPESDSTPHINVGAQYQCNSLPKCQSGKEKDDREPSEHLLWNPEIGNLCTDSEGNFTKLENETYISIIKFLVDMYLDFACCAAVPGGGRNKEYALHLLHMCGGNIHVCIGI